MTMILDAERQALRDTETGRLRSLSPTLCRIAEILVHARGHVVSDKVFNEALGHVGDGWPEENAYNTLRVHVTRLRNESGWAIDRVQHRGYVLDDQGDICPTCGRPR